MKNLKTFEQYVSQEDEMVNEFFGSKKKKERKEKFIEEQFSPIEDEVKENPDRFYGGAKVLDVIMDKAEENSYRGHIEKRPITRGPGKGKIAVVYKRGKSDMEKIATGARTEDGDRYR